MFTEICMHMYIGTKVFVCAYIQKYLCAFSGFLFSYLLPLEYMIIVHT